MPKLEPARPDAATREYRVDEVLAAEERKDLLRFLTCGSVDDGKSTLIGRLLYDLRLVYDDRLGSPAADARRLGTTGETPDLALLIDSLQAEREQGLTIDVAYRYFATPHRKFIVADTPGHEQYTRNMATGASTCDVAVLVVDACRGVAVQTRRHAYILSLLGIKKAVLAINKMDLVGYRRERFESIAEEFSAFARGLGFEQIVSVPISALKGDNVLIPSPHMHWYSGPTLMAHLETVDVGGAQDMQPFRMPVQWVNCPHHDFRGCAGTIVAGVVRPGDEIVVLPSGRKTRIDRIITYNGDIEAAQAGDAVTLTLADEITVSRGDTICAPSAPAQISDQLAAHVIWMNEAPMLPGRSYLLKSGTQTAMATFTALKHKINVITLEHQAGKMLELNDIGFCNLSLNRPLVFDPYRNCRDMGGFIIIDRFSNATLGAGMIEFGLRRATNIQWQALDVDKRARAEIKGQRPCVLWFTGLPAAGKSTIANLVEKKLYAQGRHTYLMDGDNVRHGLSKDLGFTDADRVENIRRIAETAKLFVDAGLIVMVALISPFRSERQMARELFADGEFIEIFVDTPLEICERRDPKGLYRKARAGLIKNFTGIDSVYEAPVDSEIHLSAGNADADELAQQIVTELERRGLI